jgi:hypothetical protein
VPPPARGSSGGSGSGGGALATLPHALVVAIFALLRVDERGRCACVCRAFRAALQDGAAWASLALSPRGADAPVPHARVTDALLVAAAARARGGLRLLDVRGCAAVTFETLLTVVAANAASLRRLVAGDGCFDDEVLEFVDVTALCVAVPALEALEAPVICDTLAEACALATAAPPHAPVRLRELLVELQEGPAHAQPRGVHTPGVCALAAALRARPAPRLLQRLKLFRLSLADPLALDTVVDAALDTALPCLCLYDCDLTPASVPALARLLRGAGALETLEIEAEEDAGGARLLDGVSAALLGAALRANGTLTALSLNGLRLWDDFGHGAAPAAAAALLAALTGHPRLRTLNFLSNAASSPAARNAAGAALGALLAANAPALTALDVSWCELHDAGLAPIIAALRESNTHLRRLDVSQNDASAAFGAGPLLAAVRANGSLRWLDATEEADIAEEEGDQGGGEAAMAHVRARAAAEAAGAGEGAG